MAERVEPLDLGVAWEPNEPRAVLLVDDRAAVLALQAHFSDADQRCVVLALRPSYSARIGSPNDEALTHHPLYGKGLESVGRVGIVRDSSAVRTMRPQWSAKVLNPSGPGFIDRPMPTHYIVLVKECTVEVLANDVAIFRLDGTTLEAATCCATGPR